jgi:16S rRNA (guanine527-N7)-methyltransferase
VTVKVKKGMKSIAEYLMKRRPILLQLGFNEAYLPALSKYLDLLCSSNEELNLISRKMTYEELIDNHVIDCLLPMSHMPKDIKTIADFGSGGGLPGVIYAIQFPNISFHLFEKSSRKQDFLERCQAIAPNIILRGEISSNMADVDLVTARAFKPIDVILDMSRGYYENSGKYFLLKARREKINEEILLARKQFKNLDPDIIELKSPILDVERNLVFINK